MHISVINQEFIASAKIQHNMDQLFMNLHLNLLRISCLVLISYSKGGGMYLIFPVIVIVTVIVLLQCLSCSFGQN